MYFCHLWLGVPDEGELASGGQRIQDEGLFAFLRVPVTSLGSVNDRRLLLAERLPESFWSSEAGGFIDGDPSESFREDGAASLRIAVVVRLHAEEQVAEVGTLGLQLGERPVEEAVSVVQQEDPVRSL